MFHINNSPSEKQFKKRFNKRYGHGVHKLSDNRLNELFDDMLRVGVPEITIPRELIYFSPKTEKPSIIDSLTKKGNIKMKDGKPVIKFSTWSGPYHNEISVSRDKGISSVEHTLKYYKTNKEYQNKKANEFIAGLKGKVYKYK